MNFRFAAALAAAAFAAQAHVTQAAEPIVLKFGFPPPPNTWINTVGITPWGEEVSKRTNDMVKVQVFGGGSVVNFRNVYDRVQNSVVDMGYGALAEVCEPCVRVGVSSLPFEADSSTAASVALWKLVADGTAAEDFARVKPLAVFGLPSGTLHTKSPVTKLEDAKGMKLIASGRWQAMYADAIGAVPVTITNAEAYQALDRGLANGIFLSVIGLYVFKADEVVKNHLEVPFGVSAGGFFMNKESFAKLPDDAKKAFDETTGAPLSARMGKAADEQNADARAKVVAGGGHFVKLDAAETARWKQKLDPVVQEWLKNTPDGPKVLAAFRAEMAKARSGGS
jgi:TRAP-type C4-dicarboxylate transport system substrate-binding protein